jgi:oligosaccharide repeat unit polymerase
MQKSEWLQQALYFTPFWFAVDLCIIAHLMFSWISSVRKTGWKVDFWYSFLFLNFLIPVFIMYPFNGSIYNFIAVGLQFSALEPYIDQAFAITLFGYFFLWIGRYAYDFFEKKRTFKIGERLALLIENNIQSKTALHFLLILTFLLGAAIIMLQIQEGYLFNPRRFFLENHDMRPLFNLAVSIFPLSFLFLSLRSIALGEKSSTFFFFLLLLLSIFLGIRAILIGAIVNYFLLKIYAKKGRANLFLLSLSAVGALCFIFLLEMLREGNPLVGFGKAIINIFYGNNFSEMRDFAWILSCWDEELALGKTYLAGFISFLPRFISSYRQEWAISLYTNSLVELNSEAHPGLRFGLFGEPYINFGYLGVILIGLFSGFLLRAADCKLKTIIETTGNLIRGYCSTLFFLIVYLLFSSVATWSIYVFLILNLLFAFSRRVKVY